MVNSKISNKISENNNINNNKCSNKNDNLNNNLDNNLNKEYKKTKRIYWQDESKDVIFAKNQDYTIDDKYKWSYEGVFSKLLYKIAKCFGYIYCTKILKINIVNKDILKQYEDSGYFIYGNHTQEISDVFMPALFSSKKINVIGNQANLSIPIIGKLLPILRILPVPNNFSQAKMLDMEIKKRINKKQLIVIYPEKHVFPYYTKIRDFESNSFKYPVNLNVPCFCFTTTYSKKKDENAKESIKDDLNDINDKKKKINKNKNKKAKQKIIKKEKEIKKQQKIKKQKPNITVYIDRPFFANESLGKKQKCEQLKDEILNAMKKRAVLSNYDYIEYIKLEDK